MKAISIGFCAALIAALPVCAIAEETAAPHRFKEFPAKVYRGKVARAKVLHHPYYKDYRESFSAQSSDGVNFAGHYVLVTLPCGSTCVAGAILDARTGKVKGLPFTVSGWREVDDDFEGINVRPNSRLIVFKGSRNENRPVGYHYYVMENGDLNYLRTIENDGNFDKPLKHD